MSGRGSDQSPRIKKRIVQAGTKPGWKKIDDVLSELVNLKSTLASKEDIKGLDKRLENVEKDQSDTHKRLDKLERELERGGPRRNEDKRSFKPREPTDRQQVDYLDARRSLLISPAEAHPANVKDFLIAQMKISQDVVRDMEIGDIRQIHPKNVPSHRLGSEARKVKFRLRNSYERDLVLSYNRNLSGNNRVDIVIPDFLIPLKSKFDAIGYKLRHHTNKTGNKISTSIRLDDKTTSLTMAVRDSQDVPWLHYTLEELKQLESSLIPSGPDLQEDEEFLPPAGRFTGTRPCPPATH